MEGNQEKFHRNETELEQLVSCALLVERFVSFSKFILLLSSKRTSLNILRYLKFGDHRITFDN